MWWGQKFDLLSEISFSNLFFYSIQPRSVKWFRPRQISVILRSKTKVLLAKHPFSIPNQLSLHLCLLRTNVLGNRFESRNASLDPSRLPFLASNRFGSLVCRRETPTSMLVGSIQPTREWRPGPEQGPPKGQAPEPRRPVHGL